MSENKKDVNSCHYNSGNCNSGYRNSGDYNSGNRNSGYRNSGNCNSGDYNSGNYNSGDYNSGWFNTDEPKMRFFNKESNITYSNFCDGKIVYPELEICYWVKYDDLEKSEQNEHTKTNGGMLKIRTYKEAWAKYWENASEEDKEWFMMLPNFDAKIFEEITGIDVSEKSLAGKEVEVVVDGKKYKAVIK